MTTDKLKRELQRRLGVTQDGIIGAITIRAALAALNPASPAPEDEPEPDGDAEFDERTEKCLATLLPSVNELFRKLLRYANSEGKPRGIQVKAISGSRTFAEQDALYAQGRTQPGRIVTNAKAGQSNHNFQIALDLGCFSESGHYLDGGSRSDQQAASNIYKSIAGYAKSIGLEWGGDWQSIKDEPHFQYGTGLSIAEMRRRVRNGESIV